MDPRYRDILNSFDESSIPDLDVAVLGALELLGENSVPSFDFDSFENALVVGSGGALETARILFGTNNVSYANESNYKETIDTFYKKFHTAVIVSASGGKDAVSMAEYLKTKGIETYLLTNNRHAPAASYIETERVKLFPKNREPYTYNTSTYMGMLFSKTKEEVEGIYKHIKEVTSTQIRDDLKKYDAFYFILPPEVTPISKLFQFKFDELFGGQISLRVFTESESWHAKTVVSSDTECFVSFGKENITFGDPQHRIHIPLPESSGYLSMMAIGYYIIGQIQKQHPPYFKENIASYIRKASEHFGEDINIIVS